MGGVFARGFLRLGRPVIPVTRRSNINDIAREISEPALALVAVGESDLQSALSRVPEAWQSRLGLLQNELLPRDWIRHKLHQPTVISVWFEKKKGQDAKVLIPSPVFGPQAGLLVDALATLEIPARALKSADELEYELVRKNVYILTTNIAGLEVGGTVKALWDEHESLARAIANDVISIQESLTGHSFDREQLIQGMVEGMRGDPEHKCMGRSAPDRLARALTHADAAGLAVPELRRIARMRRP